MSRAGASDRAVLDSTTMLVNISIIPTRDVSNAIVGLSEQLAGCGGLFEIDNIDRHAHATLYMARFRRETVEELLLRVKKAVIDIEQIPLEHDGYFFTPGNYYEVSYRRERPLIAAHHRITHAVRSLRYTDTPVVHGYYGPYSAAQQANVH